MSEASAVFYLNATVKVTYIHGGIKCCQCFVSLLWIIHTRSQIFDCKILEMNRSFQSFNYLQKHKKGLVLYKCSGRDSFHVAAQKCFSQGLRSRVSTYNIKGQQNQLWEKLLNEKTDDDGRHLGDEGASLLHLGRVRCDSHKGVGMGVELLLQAEKN